MTPSRQSTGEVYNGARLRRFARRRAGERDRPRVSEHDTKRIVRQWNREIEEETRRLSQRAKDDGPWKLVVWTGLWFLWLGLLLGLVSLIRPLH
jgi:hypothetical protein